MSHRVRVGFYAALGGLCAACATPAPPREPADSLTLGIEIGRYGYMLTQVDALAPLVAPGAQQSKPGDAAERAALHAELAETVWRLNAVRAQLCRTGFDPKLTCVAPLRPAWLADPAPPASLDIVQARADAVGAAVMAVWNAVCAAAPSDPNEPLGPCPIE